MASFYENYGELSQPTQQAWRRFRQSNSFDDRRDFYLNYLSDVVPMDVVVLRINDQRVLDIRGTGANYVRRDEIKLFYEQRLFMTCVVSMDYDPNVPERFAGTLAQIHWRMGECVYDHLQEWGMFTALDNITFCRSVNGTDWVRRAEFHPIDRVREVVTYFRREFERVRNDEEVRYFSELSFFFNSSPPYYSKPLLDTEMLTLKSASG